MSSSNIRVVKFNEDLFKTPSRTQKRKKPDKPIKIKPAKKVSNKSIKNSILKEIRKNQEKKYNELLVEPTITTNSLTKDFENDFKNSVDFMKKVADKHKETKLNQTIRNHNASIVHMQSRMEDTDLIPVDLDTIMVDPLQPSFNQHHSFAQSSFNQHPSFNQPSSFVQPSFNQHPSSFNQHPSFNQESSSFNQHPSFNQESSPFNQEPLAEPMKILPNPNFGCLKNGSLPTYRSYYNKTMKAGQSQPLMTERIKSPAELLLIENIKQREIQKNTKNQIHKQKRYKKLIRRTYRVGKDKYRPRVGVLLPNKTIRSNVTTKSYMLKQTPIDEIRKTLVKQGFIKVGSSAPNDVLQKIYESIKMIDGDINNHNPDNLLYNFFNQPS